MAMHIQWIAYSASRPAQVKTVKTQYSKTFALPAWLRPGCAEARACSVGSSAGGSDTEASVAGGSDIEASIAGGSDAETATAGGSDTKEPLSGVASTSSCTVESLLCPFAPVLFSSLLQIPVQPFPAQNSLLKRMTLCIVGTFRPVSAWSVKAGSVCSGPVMDGSTSVAGACRQVFLVFMSQQE